MLKNGTTITLIFEVNRLSMSHLTSPYIPACVALIRLPLKHNRATGFPPLPCICAIREVYQLVNFLTTATVANTRPTIRPKSEIMERAVGAAGNRMPTTRVKSELSRSRKASRAACRFAGIVTA